MCINKAIFIKCIFNSINWSITITNNCSYFTMIF